LQLQQQEEEEEARRVQNAKGRLSTSKNAPNSLSPLSYGGGGGGAGGNGSASSSSNSILHPTQVYESDEQMAARLHQEYLVSSQQELRRNQSQAYPPAPVQNQQAQQNYNRYSGYMPQPAPQIYEAYPPPTAVAPATQRPYTTPSPTSYRPPAGQPQQYHPSTLSTSASQRRPNAGGNSSNNNQNARNRNSSEGSDRSTKEKCTIM